MPKVHNKSGIPVTVLIEELMGDDQKKKIIAVQNLDVICAALGVERTKNELIPFLSELLDEDDELLLSLADSLVALFELLGNVQNLTLLFAVFENLCKLEDQTIRQKAIAGFKQAMQQIDVKKNEDLVMAVLKRFFEFEYFGSKASLAQLIPVVYSQISQNNQNELQSYYTKMILDESPQVRKAASQNLKEMAKLFPIVSENFVVCQVNQILKDDLDYVRQGLVETVINMSKISFVKNQGFQTQVLKFLSEDASWRVKYLLYEKFPELATAFNKDFFKKNMLPLLIRAFSDTESEIKQISALKIENLVEYLDSEDALKVIQAVKPLIQDPNAFVRSSLASSVLVLSELLGKKQTTEQILPIFLSFLKDADPDVRIVLFKKIHYLSKIIGIDTLSQSTVPALLELASDKNWRVRTSSIEIVQYFAKNIGQEFLNDKIQKVIYEWITDKVFAVREASVQLIRQLVEFLGNKWVESNLMNKVISLQTNQNYLQRLTVLFTIRQVYSCVSVEFQQKQLIPTLQNMTRDSVANIRLNIAKSIKSIYPTVKDKNDKDHLKRILQQLSEDQDLDVKQIAKCAIEQL